MSKADSEDNGVFMEFRVCDCKRCKFEQSGEPGSNPHLTCDNRGGYYWGPGYKAKAGQRCYWN